MSWKETSAERKNRTDAIDVWNGPTSKSLLLIRHSETSQRNNKQRKKKSILPIDRFMVFVFSVLNCCVPVSFLSAKPRHTSCRHSFSQCVFTVCASCLCRVGPFFVDAHETKAEQEKKKFQAMRKSLLVWKLGRPFCDRFQCCTWCSQCFWLLFLTLFRRFSHFDLSRDFRHNYQNRSQKLKKRPPTGWQLTNFI